jgi:lipoic acid synthetase
MIHTKLHKPKIKISTDKNYKTVKKMVQESYLNTVCAEARCPNIYECWNRKTATLMILGDTCTRACGFCSVKTGKPTWNDPLEPLRVAQAVKKMGLRHVVITSVDRDDLKRDYGASIWADTIKQTKKLNTECTVEVLTPDFKGYEPALKIVFDAKPDIFSHNVECVERISKAVRAQANWQRSLDVLKKSIQYGLRTKTGNCDNPGPKWKARYWSCRKW